MTTLDLIASFLGAIITLMVLSYLIGDNPLFRLAIHLFIGSASGYAGAIAWHNVLRPGLVQPLFQAGLGGIADPRVLVTAGLPLILVIVLLMKLTPRTARYGTLSMALLVGVGAAVVVGGSISGTLIPQTLASMESLSPAAVSPQTGETGLERMINVSLVLLGTVTSLLYFRFGQRQSPTGEPETPLAVVGGVTIPGPAGLLRAMGKGFIAITFGVMYAGALSAALVVLAERLQFLRDTISRLISSLS
jgi:hypothetical protein